MDKQEQFNRALGSLYEAMLDDELWLSTSGLVDELVEMEGSHLVVANAAPSGEVNFLFEKLNYRGGNRAELARWFIEDVAPHDPRVARILELPHGVLMPSRDMYTPGELRTGVGYNEGLAACDAQKGISICMDGRGGTKAVWVLANPVHGDGWSNAQLDLVQAFLPHVLQFVRVRQVVADADAMGATLTGLLDQTGVGVLQLDRRGTIMASNGLADAILVRNDGLQVRCGVLAARSNADNAKLARLLASALPSRGSQGLSTSMVIHRWPDGRYALHICPVAPQKAEPGFATVAAVVLVVDPAARPRLEPERVAAVLGLTRAEGQVAAALAEGSSVRDIAAHTGRAESTVRWTVKRIHAKLGITRQADLVRMVLSATGGVVPGS